MLMLPDSLEWVLEMLGFQWPNADEDKLLECAQVWRQFAADITEIQVQGVSSAGNVLGENYGDSIDGFRTTWEKFSGGSGYLDDARSAAEMIAFTFEAAAMLVIGMKLAVIAQLIILACEIIAAQAAAPFTLGLSELGAMGAVAATRLIVRQIIKECAQQLLQAVIETAKEPFVSALQAMVSDVIAQTVNQNFGAQSGYDLGRTARTGLDEGVNAAKNSAATFGESLRDGAGSRAGRGVRDGMDSAAGRSPDAGGDGGGSDGGNDGSGSSSSGSSRSSDSSSDSSSSGSSGSSSGPSGSSSSDGTGASGGSGTGANSATGTGGQGNTSSGDRAADGGGSTPASASAGDGNGAAPSPWADPAQRPTDTTGQDYAPSPFDAPATRPDSGDAVPATDTSSTPDGGERRATPGENIPGGGEPSRADSDAPRSMVGDGTANPQSDGPAPGQNPPGDDAPTRSDDSSAADPSQTTDRSSGPEPRTAPEPHRVDSPPPADGAPVAPDRPDPAPATPDPSPSPSPDPVSPTDPTPAADTRTGAPVDPGPGSDPAQSRDDSSSQAGGSRPGMPNATMPHGGPDRTHSGSYAPQPGPAHTADPESEGMALQGSATATAPPPTTPPADAGPTQHNPAPGTPQNTAPTTTPAAPGPVPHQTPQTAQPGPASRPTTPRADRPAPPRDGNIADVTRQTPTTRPPYDPRLDGPRRDGPRRGEAGTQTPGRIPPQRAPQRDGQDQSRPDAGTPNPNDTADRDRTRTDVPQQDERTGPAPDNRQPATDTQQSPPPQGDPTPDSTPEQSPDQQSDNQQDQNADQPRPESLQTIRDELETHPGGLLTPDQRDQQRLENSLPRNADGTPQRFADPFGPWNQLQNDGGFEMPGRSNNCADCSRSFLETWYGNPQVSAPRTPDTSPDGTLDRMSPENDSFNNMARWAGAPNTWAGNDHPNPYNRVAWDLYQAGHGAAAVVGVMWPGGGGHAFNAVNHHGRIIWIDTQSGTVSDKPIHLNADGVYYIPFDADRKPLQPWPSTDQNSEQNDSTASDGSSEPQDRGGNSESDGTTDNGAHDGATGAPDPRRPTPADHGAPSTHEADDIPAGDHADRPADAASPQPPGDPDPQPHDGLPDDGPHTADQETADDQPESHQDSGEHGAEGAETSQPNPDGLHAIRDDLNTQPGGLLQPDAGDQQALADSVPRNSDGTPQRFPDPFQPWSGLQNDGGTAVSGRSNNCADCSRSFLETWYGDPQVSAPRTPDTDENGKPDRWSPENDANDHQIRWSGARHSYAGTGDDPNTAARIAHDLQQAGHGAAAIVQVDWKGGGAHAFNAVNHHGKIVWIDTQSGQVSTTPLHLPQAKHAWYIPLDANRQPLHADQAVAKPDTSNDDSSQTPTVDHAPEADHSSEASQPTENDPTTASNDGPMGPDTKPGTGERESVPGQRNANASTYLANALRGDPFVYGGSPGDTRTGTHTASGGTNTSADSPQGPGHRASTDVAPSERETASGTSRHRTTDPGRAPAEPGTNPDEASNSPTDPVRERRLRQLARANTDPGWFKDYYKKNGHRHRVEIQDENGDRLPQLHPADDPPPKWMLASDVPDADPATTIASGAGRGTRDDVELSRENRDRLDEVAKRRDQAIKADHEPHKSRERAKDAYEKNKTPDNKKVFDEAAALHSPLHARMTQTSEEYGDKVAEFHAIPKHFPDAERIDDRGTGNNRFDQIWRLPGEPPEFVVVEAKGSLNAGLGQRRGLPEDSEPGDGAQDSGDRATGAARPAVPMVAQGTRPYFKAILHEMVARSEAGIAAARSDAELQRAEAEEELAAELRKAIEERRLTYVVVKAGDDGERHGGYKMEQFDIRTEEEKINDQRSAP